MVSSDAGRTVFAARAIGVTRATHLVMTGVASTADKAFWNTGIYRLCESEKLEKRLRRINQETKNVPGNSYKAMKRNDLEKSNFLIGKNMLVELHPTKSR